MPNKNIKRKDIMNIVDSVNMALRGRGCRFEFNDREDLEFFDDGDDLGSNDRGQISDGYHTFDELYDHRITLFIALCYELFIHHNLPNATNKPWKSKLHSDGTSWDGWFIAGINKKPGEQISYHIPIERWDELKAEELDRAPEWDGHTPADVIERIKKYLF